MTRSARTAFALACLLLPCLARAAPMYSLTAIEAPESGANLFPTSINDRGEVTGYFGVPGIGARTRPFAWYGKGRARELPVPAGYTQDVTPNAINNHGEVVGRVGNETVIWSRDGSVRTIAPPAGHTLLDSRDLNDAGTVLSLTHTLKDYEGNEVAVRRHADGSVEELPDFFPNAMNRTGAAVGGGDFSLAGATVWEADGTVRRLLGPGGRPTGGQGWDINDAGWVSGKIIDADFAYLAVWRPDSTIIVVPIPEIVDEDYGEGFGINNRVEVVGNGQRGGFYWTEADGLVDLGTRLDGSGAGWRVGTARDINDAGQIVASAARWSGGTWVHGGVLLTPVPEPWMPLAGAVVPIVLATRRRARA